MKHVSQIHTFLANKKKKKHEKNSNSKVVLPKAGQGSSKLFEILDKLDLIKTIDWCLTDVNYGQWALECSIYSTNVQIIFGWAESSHIVLLHIEEMWWYLLHHQARLASLPLQAALCAISSSWGHLCWQKLTSWFLCAVLTFPSTFFHTNQHNIKHQQHCGGAVVECLFRFKVTSYMLAGGIPLWYVSPSFHVSNGNKRRNKIKAIEKLSAAMPHCAFEGFVQVALNAPDVEIMWTLATLIYENVVWDLQYYAVNFPTTLSVYIHGILLFRSWIKTLSSQSLMLLSVFSYYRIFGLLVIFYCFEIVTGPALFWLRTLTINY